jgi:hypothetical protein
LENAREKLHDASRKLREVEAMAEAKKAAVLRAQYARLAGALGRPGLLLQGTIGERTIRRAVAGVEKSYGPYYQWTWKERGKTVTVNLSAAQRNAFERAIKNQRKLEATLERLRELSRRILELTTTGVPRRTSRKKNYAKD